MRLRCRLFGCALDEIAPECCRCGAFIYDDFIQHGRISYPLWRMREAFWSRWPIRRCHHCNKLMWVRPFEAPLCSEKCAEDWIPF